jgi:D-xylonolactonase
MLCPVNIAAVADYACETGENPLWHPLEQRLYWSDISAGRLFFYEVHGGRHAPCYSGRPVGGFTMQADGRLLLFRDAGNVVLFDVERAGQETVIDHIAELETTRFNDVIADPEGRVFAGSLSFGEKQNGKLYRVDCDGSWRVVSDGHATPNGMAFSPDLSKLYFNDSKLRKIYVFDYERTTGQLSGRRVFSETSETDVARMGRTDGMTIDRDGNIWQARIDGACLLEVSPAGELLSRIDMPTPRVTSLTFGGERFDLLFVTSAGGNERARYGEKAGALFCLTPGARGRAEFYSRVGV